MVTVNRRFIIERQGKNFVLYGGLLDAFHDAEGQSLETEVLQFPTEANGWTTVVRATAVMKDGRRFSDIGDADRKNVGSSIAPHCIRMAATRAKARAIRDAINVADVAIEELDAAEQTAVKRDAQRGQRQNPPDEGQQRQRPTAVPPPGSPNGPALPPNRHPNFVSVATLQQIYLKAEELHAVTYAQLYDRASRRFGKALHQISQEDAEAYLAEITSSVRSATPNDGVAAVPSSEGPATGTNPPATPAATPSPSTTNPPAARPAPVTDADLWGRLMTLVRHGHVLNEKLGLDVPIVEVPKDNAKRQEITTAMASQVERIKFALEKRATALGLRWVPIAKGASVQEQAEARKALVRQVAQHLAVKLEDLEGAA